MGKPDEPRRKSFANGNSPDDDQPQLEGFVLRPNHWWWF